MLVSEVQAPRIRQFIGSASHRTIRLKSMPDLLAGHQRPASAVLIAVVSRSESVLHWASTLLSALGFPADSMLQRNPALPNWQDGLTACDIVATDVVSATELPRKIRFIVFRMITDEFLSELREIVTL